MKFNHKFKLSWAAVFAAVMFGMLLLEFAGLIAPQRGNDLFSVYGFALIFIMAGVYFAKRPAEIPIEIKIYIVFLAWALVSRWLNRDIYLFVDRGLIAAMLSSFLFLCVGTVLSEKQRELFLDCVSIVFIVFFTLAAMAGIFVCVTNTYIHLPPENVWITVIYESYLNSLNMLSTTRLYSASWFFVTWTLLVYQLFKRRKLFVRILIVVCMAIMHFTLTLFHSRNIQICLSVCFGMLMLLIFMKLLSGKRRAIRLTVLPVITVVSVALCFLSFNVCQVFLSGLRSAAEPRFRTFYEMQENKIDPDYFGISLSAAEKSGGTVPAADEEAADNTPDTEDSAFGDSRNIAENKTMSGRTEIWKSGLTAIKENPSVALCGSLTKNVMPLVYNFLPDDFAALYGPNPPHMHSAYFQVLMMFGIPGLLLVLLWSVLMVIKMISVYFSDNGRFSMADKALTIPLAGIFVFNLAEVIIFAHLGGISGHAFYIISGLFLGCFYGKSERLQG